MTTAFGHLTKADDNVWEGLRLAARMRLAAACKHLIETGQLQRADVMRIGEVSQPQASLDLRQIMERAPDFMEHNKSKRCYVLKSGCGKA
jgi:hypothetical protein